MATRYLEFVGEDAQRGVGSSAKFWAVTVDGSRMTVRFGRIGATGQTTVKDFDNADEAEAQAAKLVAEKTRKGYVESAQ